MTRVDKQIAALGYRVVEETPYYIRYYKESKPDWTSGGQAAMFDKLSKNVALYQTGYDTNEFSINVKFVFSDGNALTEDVSPSRGGDRLFDTAISTMSEKELRIFLKKMRELRRRKDINDFLAKFRRRKG